MRIVKLHSWGGQARAHDYEMSDGSIRTLTESEAEAMIGRCCSAASPCNHQKHDPYSICDICRQAGAL